MSEKPSNRSRNTKTKGIQFIKEEYKKEMMDIYGEDDCE